MLGTQITRNVFFTIRLILITVFYHVFIYLNGQIRLILEVSVDLTSYELAMMAKKKAMDGILNILNYLMNVPKKNLNFSQIVGYRDTKITVKLFVS